MNFRRNRYDGVSLLTQLDRLIPMPDGDLWGLQFDCDEEQFDDISNFCVYIPEDGIERLAAIELIRGFLPQLVQLDNLVQTSCEQDWRDSKSDATGFELHIANIMFDVKEKTAFIEYYGTRVNNQWTAVFRQDVSENKWWPVNFKL